MDFLTPLERSVRMAAIRGRRNKTTELVLLTLMRENGVVGWRRQIDLPGKPDFVFKKERVVVFVDGCFWHGCPLHFRLPSGNRAFWAKKIASNRSRDQRQTKLLRQRGWKVIRIWEHSLKNSSQTIRRIRRALDAESNF